jgi:hypothetical protein
MADALCWLSLLIFCFFLFLDWFSVAIVVVVVVSARVLFPVFFISLLLLMSLSYA